VRHARRAEVVARVLIDRPVAVFSEFRRPTPAAASSRVSTRCSSTSERRSRLVHRLTTRGNGEPNTSRRSDNSTRLSAAGSISMKLRKRTRRTFGRRRSIKRLVA
jgi:hypothetical protein